MEIYVLFDLNVVAEVVEKEMCSHLTSNKPNKSVRVVSSIGALAASIYVELGHLERGCLGGLLLFLVGHRDGDSAGSR